MSFKEQAISSTHGNMKYCGPSTIFEEMERCYLNQRASAKVPGDLPVRRRA